MPSRLLTVILLAGSFVSHNHTHLARAGASSLPALELFEVTDADIAKALKDAIQEASKVSGELKEFMEDAKLGDKTDTHPLDKFSTDKKFTKENTETVINKNDIKDMLEAIDKAPAAEKAADRENLLAQLIGILLHEAGHRQALINGTHVVAKKAVEGTPWEKIDESPEEDRDVKALINRLITLMEKVKCKVPGQPNAANPPDFGDGNGLKGEDPTLWMKRLREIVDQQILYRFETVAKAEPWKSKRKKYREAFNVFSKKLGELGKSTQTAQDKTKAAQSAYEDFMKAAGTEKAELEKEFDIKLDPQWDPNTFEVSDPRKPSGTFQGKPVPDCPEPKEEKKGGAGAGGSAKKGRASSTQKKGSTPAKAAKKCPPQNGGIVGALGGVTAQIEGCQK